MEVEVERKTASLLGPVDPVSAYLSKLIEALAALSQAEIWAVVRVLYDAWREGRSVYLCGNGGSAATASHMANDLNKLTIVPGQRRMKAMALTDNVPLMTAWGNDTEYANIFAEQLLNFLAPGDVVIAISGSGNSPNVLRAVEAARLHGARTVGFTGLDGGRLKGLVDHCIQVPDDHIGRQEDGHLVLDHVIANTLRWLILSQAESETGTRDLPLPLPVGMGQRSAPFPLGEGEEEISSGGGPLPVA